MKVWLATLVVLALLVPVVEAEPAGYAFVSETRYTTGSGTYTTPAGADLLIVECVGGGGAGGGAAITGLTTRAAGGGGGAGSWAMAFVTSPAASYAYAVGAGQVGSSSAAGGTAGASSFGSVLSCPGGLRGDFGVAAGASLREGGRGGISAAGDVTADGGAGGFGIVAGSDQVSGAGGDSRWGGGAASTGSFNGGRDAVSPGAGGEGAFNGINAGTAVAGGDGANGIVVIRAYVFTEPRTLVLRQAESAGANCDLGGEKVSWGQDDDRDGILDAGEVEDSVYVCDGRNGYDAITDHTVEPPGGNCAAGGFLVESGQDADRDGILDAGEVDHSGYVCHGEDGAQGEMGMPGLGSGNLTVRLLHPLVRLSAEAFQIYAYAENGGAPESGASVNLTISTVAANAWSTITQADMVSLGAGLYSYTWSPADLGDYNLYVLANTTAETTWAADVAKLSDFEGETMEITTAFDQWLPMIVVFGLFLFGFFYGLRKHPAWGLLVVIGFLGVLTQALADQLPAGLVMPWEYVVVGAAVIFLLMYAVGGLGFWRKKKGREEHDTT